jgi:hypothetical protein
MKANEDFKVVNQDSRISKYLQGLMTAEEELSFLDEIKQDSELRSKAIVAARMVSSMRQIGAEKDKALIAAIKELPGEKFITAKIASVTTSEESRSRARVLFIPRKTFVSLSAAAAVLLCVWGGYRMYDNHQMAKLGTEYLSCFDASDYVRGDKSTDSGVQLKIASLCKSIKSGTDIESVIEELKRMWSLSLKDEYNEFTEFSSQIGWALANAYVINNDKDEALQVLDMIITNEDSTPILVDKATELKKKIETRKLF